MSGMILNVPQLNSILMLVVVIGFSLLTSMYITETKGRTLIFKLKILSLSDLTYNI
jgi:hypothetical protein